MGVRQPVLTTLRQRLFGHRRRAQDMAKDEKPRPG